MDCSKFKAGQIHFIKIQHVLNVLKNIISFSFQLHQATITSLKGEIIELRSRLQRDDLEKDSLEKQLAKLHVRKLHKIFIIKLFLE
jgi:hypothetical protein